MLAGLAHAAPAVDHHQHLFSPAVARLAPRLKPIDAAALVELLDAAGIERAAVLSGAYQFGNPNRPPLEDEYERVKAENDWTAREVARFPDRLVGLCAVNPLKNYALEEIARCAANPHLRAGLKLHFGNSDVVFDDREHVRKLRDVFAAASARGMAIVLHLRPSVNRRRAYGARQARIFLDEILPAAPDVPVQIAHMAGAGGYLDPAIDRALEVFADAIARGDPRTVHLYFDVSGVWFGRFGGKPPILAARIRKLGLERMLFGSDGAVPGNSPAEAWEAFRRLPLTDEEFEVIERNVAPYLRRNGLDAR